MSGPIPSSLLKARQGFRSEGMTEDEGAFWMVHSMAAKYWLEASDPPLLEHSHGFLKCHQDMVASCAG